MTSVDSRNWICCPVIRTKTNNSAHIIQKIGENVISEVFIYDCEENKQIIKEWISFARKYYDLHVGMKKLKNYFVKYSADTNTVDDFPQSVNKKYSSLLTECKLSGLNDHVDHDSKHYDHKKCLSYINTQWFVRIHSNFYYVNKQQMLPIKKSKTSLDTQFQIQVPTNFNSVLDPEYLYKQTVLFYLRKYLQISSLINLVEQYITI